MARSTSINLFALTALAGLSLACGGGGGGGDSTPTPTVVTPPALAKLSAFNTTQNLPTPSEIPLFEVFELSLSYPVDFGTQASFLEVDVATTFTSPTGAETTVGGFFYDTLPNGDSIWKVRFAPREVGAWTYSYSITYPDEMLDESGAGSFTALPSSNPGFLRINPTNPYRWQFDDGSPFAPLGLNVCIQRKNAIEMDGGDRFSAFRGDAQGRPPMDVYLKTHRGAGFNLFRFSPSNCTPDISTDDFTRFFVAPAKDFDRVFYALREYDYTVFFGFFGFLLRDRDVPPTAEELRFLTYCVNRWGAFVDVWELQNEHHSTAEWIDPTAAHVRALDPYEHPISTSWRRPEVDSIEVNAPHWYTNEDVQSSDQVTAGLADMWKAEAQKPVLVGETGNAGSSWSPGSGLRARIRSWTAFFKEIGFVFWDASWATNYVGLTIYIGPEERRQFHVLQWFSSLVLQADTVEVPLQISEPGVRGYSLRSMEGPAVYLHHFADHQSVVSGMQLAVDATLAGEGHWIDPTTGRSLGTVLISPGVNQLTVPDFSVDVAFFTRTLQPKMPPLALLSIDNPQDDGDADDDGKPNYGPAQLPFGIAPLELNFDASDSYDPDGGQIQFEWDFGDGSTLSSDWAPTHTFARGIHVVTLKITDGEGDVATQSFLVRATADVTPNFNEAPTLAAMGLEDVTVREGEPLVITPTATDRELIGNSYFSDEIVTYFADNLPPGATFFGNQSDPALSWTPDFTQSGTYTVNFRAADQAGETTQTRSVTITVLDVPEEVDAATDNEPVTQTP